MLGRMIEHNTCDMAQKQGHVLEEMILEMAKEKSVSEKDPIIFQGNSGWMHLIVFVKEARESFER